MLKAVYNDDAMVKTVFEWFSCFKSEIMLIDDQPVSEHPSTAQIDRNVEKLHEIILHHQKIVEKSRVTWRSSVQKILNEDLGLRRMTTQFVSRLLIAQQKQGSVDVCSAFKEEFQNDPNIFFIVDSI